MTTGHFGDRLVAAIDQRGTPACVGLDPVVERLPAGLSGEPADAIGSFCLGVIDAVGDVVPVVKPQSACFERYGSAGLKALEMVVSRARELGLLVVLDAKRGDIGASAAHYAAGVAALGADAVTVNAYLGPSGVQPFIEAGLGVFCLVRTSNPDSDEVQAPRLETGETVAERMASMVAALGSGRVGAAGLSSVGAVVGATKAAADGRRLRELLPDAPLLVPGIGAQGGTVEAVRGLLRVNAGTPGAAGVLVTASRSVLYPRAAGAPSWTGAVGAAARRFACDAASLVPGHPSAGPPAGPTPDTGSSREASR